DVAVEDLSQSAAVDDVQGDGSTHPNAAVGISAVGQRGGAGVAAGVVDRAQGQRPVVEVESAAGAHLRLVLVGGDQVQRQGAGHAHAVGATGARNRLGTVVVAAVAGHGSAETQSLAADGGVAAQVGAGAGVDHIDGDADADLGAAAVAGSARGG